MDKINLISDTVPFKSRLKKPSFRFEFVLEKLRNYFGDKKLSVLDVGCGTGLLSRLLMDLKHDVTAVDIDKNLFPEIKKNCKNKVNVHSSLDEVSGQFDAIACLQTLEHDSNPPDIMVKKMKKLLKPGGLLIITTPIEECLKDVEHYWFFNFYDILAIGESISPVFEIYFIDKFERKGSTTNCFALVAQKI